MPLSMPYILEVQKRISRYAIQPSFELIDNACRFANTVDDAVQFISEHCMSKVSSDAISSNALAFIRLGAN